MNNKTQKNAEITQCKNKQSKLLYEKESYLIRGACFDLYKKLGHGHKEIIYQRGLQQLLEEKGLKSEREKKVKIILNGKCLGNYTPDFVVNEIILIETKAKKYLTIQDRKQFWQYLKATNYKLGFLVNFGKPGGVEIVRRIYDTARRNVPHDSA